MVARKPEPSVPPSSGATEAIAPPAAAPAPPRPARLVSLEREAAARAEDAELIEPAVLERRLRALPRERGESDGDFRRRIDEHRERLLAEELLVQYQLASMFETTEYPNGFDVEQSVVAVERGVIAGLPAEDRAQLLEILLDRGWEPHRAVPRIGSDIDSRLLSWVEETGP